MIMRYIASLNSTRSMSNSFGESWSMYGSLPIMKSYLKIGAMMVTMSMADPSPESWSGDYVVSMIDDYYEEEDEDDDA